MKMKMNENASDSFRFYFPCIHFRSMLSGILSAPSAAPPLSFRRNLTGGSRTFKHMAARSPIDACLRELAIHSVI